MIARYNRLSFVFGVPGVVLQIAPHFLIGPGRGGSMPLGVSFILFGTVLLMIGLAYYAKAKGQSPVWCAAAFLSIIGLLLLLLLEDKSESTHGAGEEYEKA